MHSPSCPPSAVSPPPSASIGLQPIVPALALALRGRAAFGFEFLRRIIDRLRAQIGWLRTEAEKIRAIDDTLEAVAPKLERALANDPPALRREILAALRATHAATEARAAELTPACPEHLLRD